MEKLRLFISSKKNVIIFNIINITVCYVVSALFKVRPDVWKLTAEIIILFTFIYLFVSFFSFSKEYSYMKKAEELEQDNRELKKHIIDERNDILEYFSIWVHQIKTPITAANLIVQNSDDYEEMNKIKRELISIEDYTNMALNYLKMKNQDADMFIDNVCIDDIIRPVIKKYSILFISNGISLDYSRIENRVTTDPKWFSILFEQILSNSIKYTKDGTISIEFIESLNCLSIKDTGIGISKSDLPKIFDRGYSGFNGKMNKKSTGLGLFLVKNISEKLSIKLEVKSEVDVGTEFRLYIPESSKYE